MPDHEVPGEAQRMGIRLAVAAGGTVALLVPFGLILALVVGNAGWLHRADVDVSAAFHRAALASDAFVDAMAAWSLIFDPNSWRAAALLLAFWLLRRRRRSLAVWVVVTMAAGGVLGAVLKLLVGRHRPGFLDPVAQAAGYSFPSGHALNNALGAAVLLLVLLPLARHRPLARRAMWLAAVVIPLLTGLSRIGLGVHWLSDVVAGWLLGVAVAAATAWTYLAWRGDRPQVTEEGLAPELADEPADA